MFYIRSPFGDPNMSPLSPIPKSKIEDVDDTPLKGRSLRFSKSPIHFDGTQDFDDDGEGESTALETSTNTKKNIIKEVR